MLANSSKRRTGDHGIVLHRHASVNTRCFGCYFARKPTELQPHDRKAVEAARQSHCDVRMWKLLAVNARTNYVHAVVVVNMAPKKARDQLKANCTRALRVQATPLIRDRTWTRGGDCEILETENAVNQAVKYILEGQD